MRGILRWAAVVMDIGSLPRLMQAQVARWICWPGKAEAHERTAGLMTRPPPPRCRPARPGCGRRPRAPARTGARSTRRRPSSQHASLAALSLGRHGTHHERRWANELIGHAQQLTAQQVTLGPDVPQSHRRTPARGGPDQLLDLLAVGGRASWRQLVAIQGTRRQSSSVFQGYQDSMENFPLRTAGRRAVIRRYSCRRPPSQVPATTVNQPYIYTSPRLR